MATGFRLSDVIGAIKHELMSIKERGIDDSSKLVAKEVDVELAVTFNRDTGSSGDIIPLVVSSEQGSVPDICTHRIRLKLDLVYIGDDAISSPMRISEGWSR